VAVIEGGDQAQRFRQQHAVAEHVARHVAAAGGTDRVGLDVDPHLEEMPLNRDPRAARGNAHFLVVVPVRAAACERIAKPEFALERDAVGDVGEGRGPLVGGDDEIGIVAIVDDHAGRVDDPVVDDVVGDRQQRADEYPVGFRAFGKPRIAARHGRELLGEEAALGAGRDDHGILDHLRLHQTENFGAEVVAPVRPAQSAARDRPAAQVDTLDARGINPDLAPRHRGRKPGHHRRIDLERERFLGRGGERVGADHRLHQRAQPAQDTVVVDRADPGERAVELVAALLDRVVAPGRLRIVGGDEQPDQRAGRVGRAPQRIDHGDEAEAAAGLAKIAEPGAQPHHRARVERGVEHELIELVVLGRAAQHVGDRALDLGGPREDRVEVGFGADFDVEVMDEAGSPGERGREFLEHSEAEILEHRNRFGQRNKAILTIGLEPKLARAVGIDPRNADVAVTIVGQRAQAQDVGRAFHRRAARAIAVGKGVEISQRKTRCARRASGGDELGLDRRIPAANHFDHGRIERLGRRRWRVGLDILGVANEREVAVAELDRPTGDLLPDALFEQFGDRVPALRAQFLARQPHEREQLALEDASNLHQPRARAIGQRHRHHH